MSSEKKYLRDLLRHLPKGYTVHRLDADVDLNRGVRKSGGKAFLHDADGNVVRDAQGRPIGIATSSSTPHAVRAKLTQIRKAGVEVKR